MKFSRYLFTVMALCVCFACCGCERNTSLVDAKFSATVDGEECMPFYSYQESHNYLREQEAYPYLLSRDYAVPITGTSHDITLTIKNSYLPDFTQDNIEMWAIVSTYIYEDSKPYLIVLHYILDYEITDFQYEKGKICFHFEMQGEFPDDTVMFTAIINYVSDVGRFYINMSPPGLCPAPVWPPEK